MAWQPLVFEPYLRPQIWGGRALGDRFAKSLPTDGLYGESWEISGHPHHISIVREGPNRGRSLTELCEKHPRELFGNSPPANGEFPLLIKLLDCHDLLSVQVHPDDAKAKKILGEDRGKTESWVVLDSGADGVIYAGLKPGVDRATFESHMKAETTGECLHQFHPKAGDCVHIPAGTVHTMGGGVLIAEIQQSSDATFRIFDWNRRDAQGNARQLHRDESLASIDFERGPVGPVTPNSMAGIPSPNTGERLVECPYYRLDRIQRKGDFPIKVGGSLTIWIVASGRGRLAGEGYAREFQAGETVLVPADSIPLAWQPAKPDQSTCLLRVSLPS